MLVIMLIIVLIEMEIVYFLIWLIGIKYWLLVMLFYVMKIIVGVLKKIILLVFWYLFFKNYGVNFFEIVIRLNIIGIVIVVIKLKEL